MIQALNGNNASLLETTHDVASVSMAMQTHVTTLTQIIISFKEQLAVFTTRITRITRNEHIGDDVTSSMHDTPIMTLNHIDDIMANSDAALSNAAIALETFERYIAHDNKTSMQTASSTNTLETNAFTMGCR